MRVTLIKHTTEPEKVVAAAAKLCYSSSGIDDLLEKLDTQNIAHFLQKLINMGHESP